MQRAAIVGLGWWGQHIFRQLRGSAVINVALAVGSREAHRPAADDHGVEFTTDLARALADPAIDLVILATPHAQHVTQIAAAARAKKHIFCEKPIGLTVADVLSSIKACRAAGVLLGVGHERRFEPAMDELRRLIRSETFGTILHVEGSFSHDKLRGLSNENWRINAAGEPPLAMTATGIHLTDLFIDLIGPIEAVTAFPANRVAFTNSPDVLSVLVRFSSGATGYLNTVLATPFNARLAVYGSEGWAEVRNATHPDQAGLSTLTVQPRTATTTVSTMETDHSVRRNLEQFALTIEGRATYPFTDEQIVSNIAVLEAVTRSVASGETVVVQTFE